MKKLNIITVLGLISLAAACGKAKNNEKAASVATVISLNGKWELEDIFCNGAPSSMPETITYSFKNNSGVYFQTCIGEKYFRDFSTTICQVKVNIIMSSPPTYTFPEIIYNLSI